MMLMRTHCILLFSAVIISAMAQDHKVKCYFPVVFLDREEQLLLQSPTGKEVRNGPGMFLFIPMVTHAFKRNTMLLTENQYVIVTDQLTGSARVEAGPQLLFLGAYEDSSNRKAKVVLQDNQYVKITEKTKGHVRIEKGPKTVTPGPYETYGETMMAMALRLNQYAKLVDDRTGEWRVQTGESLVFPGPFEQIVEGPLEAISLRKNEYVKLTDERGKVRVEIGEKLVFPEPAETWTRVQIGYNLQNHQYVKLEDSATGNVRVERGEQIVFPGPNEKPTETKDAVFVDTDTSVLIISKETGQQRLVTETGTFIPGPYEEILEVRKLIRVQPHEVAVVVDEKSNFHFYDGRNGTDGVAFFLPPYHELYTMHWGSGTSPEDIKKHHVNNQKTVAYKVPVQKIDLRASYAFFEYTVRTSDNVELILEGTIFWQVVDVPKMVATTGDPKGDVWYHARSALIQAVSVVTLEEFMKSFNSIVAKAAQTDASFYEDRGCRVHNLEVTRYECADSKTGAVLQQIIQETTNRINAMQKQSSTNDVEQTKIDGEIKVEQQRSELVKIQTSNNELLLSKQGQSDGLRLAMTADAFLSNLQDVIPSLEDRLELFKFFSTNELADKQIQSIATGNAQLFLTPEDLSLKFQTNEQRAALSSTQTSQHLGASSAKGQ